MTEPEPIAAAETTFEPQAFPPPAPTLEQQMQQKCREWQQRLRLADWDVDVKVLPAMDMDLTQLQGSVRWQFTEKTANISLVTPEDAAKQNPVRPYRIEETLIHELLHLHMAAFEPEASEQAECLAMEFAINAIAGALLKLATLQTGATNV